jgi:hypothetical protein
MSGEKFYHPQRNTKMIMALSIAEQENPKVATGGGEKSVRLVYACVMCSRSAEFLPNLHDINATPFLCY